MKNISILFCIICISFSSYAQIHVDDGTNGILSIRNASGGTLGTTDLASGNSALFVDGDITIEGEYDNAAAETQFTGNLNVSGTFKTTGDEVFLSSTAPYANNANQTVTGSFTGNDNDFHNFIVEKTTGQTIQLLSNVEVNNDLVFDNSGKVITAAASNGYDVSAFNTIFVKKEGTASIVGAATAPGDDNNYVEGKLKWNLGSTDGNYTFPVGGATGLQAVTIASTGASGLELVASTALQSNFTTEIVNVGGETVYTDIGYFPSTSNTVATGGCESGPDGKLDQLILDVHSAFGWNVDIDAGSLTSYDITLRPESSDFAFTPYNPSTTDAMCLNDEMIFMTRDGIPGGDPSTATSTVTDYMGETGFQTNPIDAIAGTYTLTGQTNFSVFGVSTGSPSTTSVLPVELMSIAARAIDNRYIEVSWATASETNNAGFEVHRSQDGESFEYLGWVDGNGTTSEINHYSFDDFEAKEGVIYYYKLKQVDFDERYAWSNVVKAQLYGENGFAVSIYPNPTKSQLFANIQLEKQQELSLRLYNALGKLLFQETKSHQAGNHIINLDLNRFSSGIYYLNINDKVFKINLIQ